MMSVVVCPDARADDSVEEEPAVQPNAWDAPVSMELHLGGYGPVGGLGGALMFTPTPYLSVMGGIGFTVSGWRAGGGIRLFYPLLAKLGVGVETWYSYGPDRRPLFALYWSGSTWQEVHTLRVVATLEYRALSGFRIRFYFGGAGLLSCDSGCRGMPPTTPTVGFAVGWAFGGSGTPHERADDASPERREPAMRPPRLPDL